MKYEKKQIKFDDIEIEDRNLWSEVVIRKIWCKECGTGDSIVIKKFKQLPKLIKALNKFNYLGLKDKRKKEKLK